ncbi:MAG: GNAT family N-acetyltransferase [Bacteroidota bacterium]
MLIKRASSAEELTQVYQIRYQCLTIELGDESHARHQEKAYYDEDDIHSARIFVAYVEDKIVGTARLLLRKEQVFIADEFYSYNPLASQLGMDAESLKVKTGLIDRVCILQEYRGHRIFNGFYESISGEMMQNNCDYLLAAIHADNHKSDVVFTHFGFHKIPELKLWEDWQGYLYYKNL